MKLIEAARPHVVFELNAVASKEQYVRSKVDGSGRG